MIGDAIAGYVGHKIDSSDGEGGALGAAVAIVTWKIATRVIPTALVLGAIAYGVHRISKSEALA